MSNIFAGFRCETILLQEKYKQLIQQPSEVATVAKKLNYLTDVYHQGLYQANPMYEAAASRSPRSEYKHAVLEASL